MSKRRDLDEVYGLKKPGELDFTVPISAPTIAGPMRPYLFDCSAVVFARMEVVRLRARRMVADAIRLGKIRRPDQCQRRRGTQGRIESHHADYSKPLDVEWLCVRCHKAETRKIVEQAQRSLPDARVGMGGPGGSLSRIAARVQMERDAW